MIVSLPEVNFVKIGRLIPCLFQVTIGCTRTNPRGIKWTEVIEKHKFLKTLIYHAQIKLFTPAAPLAVEVSAKYESPTVPENEADLAANDAQHFSIETLKLIQDVQFEK